MRKGFLITSTFTFAITVAFAMAVIINLSSSKSVSISIPLNSLNEAYSNVYNLINAKVPAKNETRTKTVPRQVVAAKKTDKLIEKKKIINKKVVVEKAIEFKTVEKKVLVEKADLAVQEYTREVGYSKTELDKKIKGVITVGEKIKVKPIKIKEIERTSLVALFKPIHNEVVSVKAVLMAEAANKNKINNKDNTEDRISTVQAANETSIQVAPKIAKSNPQTKNLQKVAAASGSKSDYSELVSTKELNLQLPPAKPVERKAATTTIDKKVDVPKKTIGKKANKPNDDLVFFDYSKPEAQSSREDEIQKWIQKELKKKPVKKMAVAKIEPVNNKVKEYGTDYSFYKSSTTRQLERFDYSFEVARIDAVGKVTKQLTYEFDFKDDYNDRIRSNTQGQIRLVGKTYHNNIRKISVYGKDLYPTTFDQQLFAGVEKVVIPTFSSTFFNKLIEKHSLRGLGGHVFVELDSLTEDVELDVDIPYEKKLYLNRMMQVVNKADSDYDYVLFVGIRPGNTIIKFKTYKNEITTKIVHVANSEVFFEPNYYSEEKKDSFRLYEEHILSKNIMPLDVDVQKIAQFSQNEKVIKSALGEYYYTKTLYPSSTRKYLELGHLNESIFVGYSKNKNIVVPSENYMQVVLDKFGVRDLTNQCIIQLNLEEKARSISIEGSSYKGAMRLTPLMLDEDGVFYEEFTAGTKRVFIHGEEQGIVNIKLNYNNGAVAYIQTYCSNKTYLIEQL